MSKMSKISKISKISKLSKIGTGNIAGHALAQCPNVRRKKF